jgi:hypothetical protein
MGECAHHQTPGSAAQGAFIGINLWIRGLPLVHSPLLPLLLPTFPAN